MSPGISALVLDGLAPLLLAAALVWAAGLMGGGLRSLPLASVLALALAHGLAGLDGMAVRLLAPALAGREWLLEALLAAGLVLGRVLWARPSWPAAVAAPSSSWRRAWGLVLLAAVMVAVWASLAGARATLETYPHGRLSDAYALWNLKARFLHRGGEEWTRLFDPQLRHTGYPLVHPALVARLWGALGSDSPAVPQGLVISYVLLAVGLLLATLHALRGWVTAALAALALLSLPFFLENAEYQCADLPLSVFALAAVGCLALGAERPVLQGGVLLLAGAFGGLAAWTKGEGLLLVGALTAAAAACGGGSAGGRLRRAGHVLAGAAPALALLAYMNAVLVRVPSPYVHQPRSVLVERALSGERHAQILSAAARFAAAEPQRLALGLLAAAAVTGTLVHRRQGRCARRLAFLVAGLMAGAFYAVYLTTPHPLPWQLDTSLGRLFVQYWPALVLGAFVGGLDPFPPAPRGVDLDGHAR